MAVVPYTDHDFTIRFLGKDLSTAREIHCTFQQKGSEKLDITDVTAASDGAGGCYLTVSLTQEQTGGFVDNEPMKMQINWVDALGKHKAMQRPKTIAVGSNLLRKILTLPNES